MREIPEKTLLMRARAISSVNIRFLVVLLSVFMLGHLHQLTDKEDQMTFWILCGLWVILCFTSERVLTWVLDPIHKLSTEEK
jgi:hypothetical protein